MIPKTSVIPEIQGEIFNLREVETPNLQELNKKELIDKVKAYYGELDSEYLVESVKSFGESSELIMTILKKDAYHNKLSADELTEIVLNAEGNNKNAAIIEILMTPVLHTRLKGSHLTQFVEHTPQDTTIPANILTNEALWRDLSGKDIAIIVGCHKDNIGAEYLRNDVLYSRLTNENLAEISNKYELGSVCELLSWDREAIRSSLIKGCIYAETSKENSRRKLV